MKHVSIVLLIVMVSIASCAINQEKEIAEESKPSSFQPEPLDDEWSKWLVGEWEIPVDSDTGAGCRSKIELGLNGQFLIMKDHGELGEMTEEQIQQLKETTNASDEDIERFLSMPFKELQIHTIDPKTGEIVGYLFDSQRCIAEGRGRRQGNKEIIEWKWSGTAQGATSISIIEKISNNKFTINHKYTLPDGRKMEGKGEVIRKETITER
jgi:hypothetical protein